ncbi:MAG: hypothetical protein V3R57_06135 [Candidatus Bathyarchaeia archaeon]
MEFSKKIYSSTDFDRLRQKHKYIKLAKLLRHKDTSVAAMAKESLNELINNDDEREYRRKLYGTSPHLYDKIVTRLQAAQSSNPNLDVGHIVLVLVQEREPLRMKQQAELEEIERLGNLLRELGIDALDDKNVRDIRALLEPNESIECAFLDGTRGNLLKRSDYALYTNKNLFFLQGIADHADWGTVDKTSYDAIHDIKEKGILIKKYEISGKSDDVCSFTVDRNHQLLKQLGKYGTEEVKNTMKQLGILDEESISPTTENPNRK